MEPIGVDVDDLIEFWTLLDEWEPAVPAVVLQQHREPQRRRASLTDEQRPIVDGVGVELVDNHDMRELAKPPQRLRREPLGV